MRCGHVIKKPEQPRSRWDEAVFKWPKNNIADRSHRTGVRSKLRSLTCTNYSVITLIWLSDTYYNDQWMIMAASYAFSDHLFRAFRVTDWWLSKSVLSITKLSILPVALTRSDIPSHLRMRDHVEDILVMISVYATRWSKLSIPRWWAEYAWHSASYQRKVDIFRLANIWRNAQCIYQSGNNETLCRFQKAAKMKLLTICWHQVRSICK